VPCREIFGFDRVVPLERMSLERGWFAGATSAEKDPEKAIPQTVIAECVKRWTAANKASMPAWAYDGRNNLYAPKTLVEKSKLTADSYQEFPLEWKDEAKRHPTRFLYGPAVPLPPRSPPARLRPHQCRWDLCIVDPCAFLTAAGSPQAIICGLAATAFYCMLEQPLSGRTRQWPL
jgi:hypothetical protein